MADIVDRSYNYKQIKDKFFLTNKEGDFIFINKEDFKTIKNRKYDKELKGILEKGNFIQQIKIN